MADQTQHVLTLNQAELGDTVIVRSLRSTGTQRRRLMDLGFVPGTRIEVELRSPMGDPIAYRIRGALIALRHEQAAEIEVLHDEHIAESSQS